MSRGLRVLAISVFISVGSARAQEDAPVVENTDWQHVDWLKPTGDGQVSTASGNIAVQSGQNVSDPFAAVSSGALDQQQYGTVYTRPLADNLTLSFETDSTLQNDELTTDSSGMDGSPDDLALGQKLALQSEPIEGLKFDANLHDSTTDASMLGQSALTTGVGCSIEGHFPNKSILTLGLNADTTSTDPGAMGATTDRSCDLQFQQPLGPLPLTAVLKAHYEQIQAPQAPIGSMPSLEQSLVWKPLPVATLQAGLRQQRYQEYPGIDNQLNEALFADWSQTVVGDITWHSYAELLNTRNLVDQAPASPIASGANGTPQATPPTGSGGLSSTLPVSLQDQTVTFSTGPSFQLQKDISASLEYSDRWDKTPAAGNVGQEQRVSVSVKGSF